MALEANVKEFGLTFFGMNDRRQGASYLLAVLKPGSWERLYIYIPGIVHIIGPEQGFTVSAKISYDRE